MNKIGLHFGYWIKDWNTEFKGAIDRAVNIGLDILEVAPGPFFDMTTTQRAAIRDYATNRNIELTFSVGLGADYDLADADETVRKNGIKYSIDTMKLVGEMGGKIYSGINYSAWNKKIDFGIENKEPYFERAAASLKEIMNVAESFDIQYCMEVVNRFEQYLLNTAEEGVKLVQMVDHPNAKILLDTFHMNIEEDSFVEAIKTTGDYLGHVHVGEANRRPPCEGRMPWDDITGALKEIGYTKGIVMEPFIKMGGEVGRDIRVWRDISQGATDLEMDQKIKDSVAFIKAKMV